MSGGSSSGSAVAVAAGLVAFGLGTDTAGSGRVPAAFNHLIGLKPSKGRWSNRGLVPACRTIDCITVFTDALADAAAVDAVLAGFDAEDAYSRPPDDVPLTGKRIGVPRHDSRVFFGDFQAEHLYDLALETLARDAEIVEIDIAPLLEAARLLYGGPWVAERTAAMASMYAASSTGAPGVALSSMAFSALRRARRWPASQRLNGSGSLASSVSSCASL